MKVEQLSIFLENKVGRLAEITETLKAEGVNIKALVLADTSEFGILRLIVDKNDTANSALKEKGFIVSSTTVIAVEVVDTSGALNELVQLLGNNQVNIEYMYGFSMKTNNPIMVFRVDNAEKAIQVLQQSGSRVLSSEHFIK